MSELHERVEDAIIQIDDWRLWGKISYDAYVEYGHPWCEDCKSFHAANVIDSTAIVLEDEEQPAQQKALPAPQQGREQAE